MQTYKTLNELFYYADKVYGHEPLFFTKDKNKTFIGRTMHDVLTTAENAAIALMDMGLQPGDKVGHMADNRTEWIIADMAALLCGAADVPRGTDSTPEEVEYILNHSEAKFCFLEHDAMLARIQPVLAKISSVEKYIILDPETKASGANIVTLNDLIAKGAALRDSRIADLRERATSVKPGDLFTIIYTSGTTGMPKGVMLTHGNMVYNVVTVPEMVAMANRDRLLSILPVWHIFERAIDYGAMANGAALYYTNVRDLKDDFQRAKPTFMASAPRVWENIYQSIKARIDKAEPVRQKLFEVAYETSKAFHKGVSYLQGNELQVKPETDIEKGVNTATSLVTAAATFLPSRFFDGLIFSKMREALGGQLRGTISGGGALPPHVDEFFNVIGIPVYEGYGMTECSPIISVRTREHLIQGTVGFCPRGTQVRVLNERGNECIPGEIGVIHVKGPQVMKGYYKNPDATAAVLKDGWMNTGDLGFISYNGSLSIRGRAKDTVVLLGGENVEPVPIENLLLENPLIDQVMVVGQDKKSLGALIWPNTTKLQEAGVSVSEGEDLNKNTKAREAILGVIKSSISAQNGFKAFERVTDFRFLPKAMEVGDEMTNLFKMKRNVITNKYQKLIDSMYD